MLEISHGGIFNDKGLFQTIKKACTKLLNQKWESWYHALVSLLCTQKIKHEKLILHLLMNFKSLST